MTARPIIFTDWQVRAVLDGRMTQVRVPVVPQPPLSEWGVSQPWETSAFQVGPRFGNSDECREYRSPFGQPGDTLWVRETWDLFDTFERDEINDPGIVIYKADGASPTGTWRSPVTMPRWASRISLAVTAVRVERVQEIAPTIGDIEDLAKSEGYEPTPGMLFPYAHSFVTDWNSRYSRRGLGWDVNPWCWVAEFEEGR